MTTTLSTFTNIEMILHLLHVQIHTNSVSRNDKQATA